GVAAFGGIGASRVGGWGAGADLERAATNQVQERNTSMQNLWKDPVRNFYLEFFEKEKIGHIVVPALRGDHTRDALAGDLVGRLFPLLDFPDITMEPSRPSLDPADNLIIIGRIDMYR